MIIDVPKKEILNSSLNKECVNFKFDEYLYNYLYSDFFLDGKFFLPISNKSLMTSTDVFRIFNKKKYLQYFNKDYISFIESNIDKFNTFTNAYVVGSYDNYFHCIMDCFPRLFCINESISSKIDTIVVGKKILKKNKILETLLENINLTKKIILIDEGTYFFKNSFIAFNQGYEQTIINYKKTFKKQLKNNSFRNIYISRSDSQNRIIKNEKSLIRYLDKYNFETHNLSELNFVDQIKLFNESKIIISMHGAGLVNLIFSNEGTKVIEIVPNLYFEKNDWFEHSGEKIQRNISLSRDHFRLISFFNNIDHYFYFSSILKTKFFNELKNFNQYENLNHITKIDLTINLDLFSKFFESKIMS